MEINFCEEGVEILNITGRIILTEEEIQRLAGLVRGFNVDRLEKALSDFQEKYRNNLRSGFSSYPFPPDGNIKFMR